MLANRPFRGVGVAALTAIVATLALAGPMATNAGAAPPKRPAAPVIAAVTSPTRASAQDFSWTSADSDTFTCSVDGAKPVGCGSGTSGSYHAAGPFGSGTHTFTVRAKLGAGKSRQSSASVSWVVDRTPPQAPTVQQVPTPTRNTSANVNFSDGDLTVSSYQCVLDSGSLTSCSPPLFAIAGPLADGPHSASVYAYDAVGNVSAAGSTTWTVDTTAPGSPTFTQTPTSPTQATAATFAWVDSDPTATAFTCSVDGGAYSTCTSPKTLNGLAGGSHTFSVQGVDGPGNVGPAATAGWVIDLTPPPAPQILSGPATSTDQSSAVFDFQDADATATFRCSLDGAAYSACSSPVTLASLFDGAHTMSVEAVDPVGNVSAASPYQWTIDTTGTIALSPVAFLGGPNAFSNIASPTFTWTALDDTTTQFLCSLDGAAFTACGVPDANSNGSKQVTIGSDGLHVFSVKASDGSNQSAAVSWSWQQDTVAPSVPVFSSTPPALSNSTSALFSFASDPNSGFTCQLDSQPVTLCASPASFDGLATTAHTFTVTAVDPAGNQSHNSYGWTVDTSAPTAATLTAPHGLVNITSASLAWSEADSAVDTVTCSLDGSSYSGACALPGAADLSGLGNGTHTFAVAVGKGAGPTVTTSASWTVDTIAPTLTVDGVPNGVVVSSTTVIPSIQLTDTHPGATTCALSGPVTSSACGSYVGLTDGAYTLTVNGVDGAGNAAPSVSRTWTVDTTPPPAASVNGPVDTASTQPTFAFTDAESPVSFACSVDGGAFGSCSSPYTVSSPLGVGSHAFAVRATDAVGNWSDSVPFGFHVSATAPVGGPVDPAPTASLSTPTTLTGAATATFSETVHAFTAGGASIVLTGTSTAVPTNVACLSGTATVACSGSFTAVRLTPSTALVPGQHYTLQLAAGAAQDSAGNPSVANSSSFRGSLAEQESSAAARATWATVKATAAYGHSFVRQSLAGATATYTFKGTNVTWWTVTGKDQGKATVYVDGVRKAYVDNYAASTHYKVARRYTRLGNRTHTLRIVVRGLKGAKAGTGTFVTVDAFSVGKTRANTPAIVMTWRSAVNRHYSAGHAAVARVKNETFSFTFRGTAVSWFTQRGVNQGKVAVYVDGVRKAVVDNYAAKTAFSVKRSVTRLADTVHTLKLVVLGTHHKGATGTWVTVDRFAVT